MNNNVFSIHRFYFALLGAMFLLSSGNFEAYASHPHATSSSIYECRLAPALSTTGPTGLIRVPSADVVPQYDWGFSVDSRTYEQLGTQRRYVQNSFGMNYGAFRNTEIGFRVFSDSRSNAEGTAPWMHVKYRFPGRIPWLGYAAGGMIYDSDEGDYSSIYMMAGPFGIGFNIDGDSTYGHAPLGGTNHRFGTSSVTGLKTVSRTNPNSAFLLFGHEIPLGGTGASMMLEYDGDGWGTGLRYRYGKIFSADVSVHQAADYWDLARLDGQGYSWSLVRGRFGFVWSIW